MNVYRHRFTVACPNNGLSVIYNLRIRCLRVVMVEEVVAFCATLASIERPYHENIADALFAKFGGKQRIRAHHHGVDIETRRG